ncbi:uncharacterized protein LOC130668485 [Microplitis mediator]|uniref:uncharacterized protein LOC130668485 n=1 Tax=Microplitis mediator TaxID=375433 RepID=UPI0025522B75|nr:uncharacterized protein LOC130668485 [Microplitis mediator]
MMEIDESMETSARHTCVVCKQDNLKKPKYCKLCNRPGHPSCISKKHRKDATEEWCFGVEGDNESVMSSSSTGSTDSRGKRKRKGFVDDTELCETVEEMLNKLEDVGLAMDGLKTEVKTIITNIFTNFKKDLLTEVREIIKNEIKGLNVDNQERKINDDKRVDNINTYADKVMKSRNEIVIIEPRKQQDSEETFQEVKNKVKVGKLGVGVESVRKIQSGKVVIGCGQKKDVEILASELKKTMSEEYNIKVTNKKLPKVKIIDIDEDIFDIQEEQEIIDMIKEQNDIAYRENLKMSIKKRIKGNKKNGILIVEVDPVTHKVLLEKNKIKLGWNRCRIFDCVSVLRCYKCCGYHHFAKDCTREIKCRRCAGNHLEKECKSDHKKCANCTRMVEEYKINGIKTDHYASDTLCEYYKRIIKKAEKNINYCAN